MNRRKPKPQTEYREGVGWLQPKCWHPDCKAPLAAVKKERGYVEQQCKICKRQWTFYVAPENAPHGGESWSLTLSAVGDGAELFERKIE